MNELSKNNLKKEFIALIRDQTERGKSVSIRKLVKKLRSNNNLFYEAFPDGLTQAYMEAGLPERAPTERIRIMKQVAQSNRSVPASGDPIDSLTNAALGHDQTSDHALDPFDEFERMKIVGNLVALVEEAELALLDATEDKKSSPYMKAQRDLITSRSKGLRSLLGNLTRSMAFEESVGRAKTEVKQFRDQCRQIANVSFLSDRAKTLSHQVKEQEERLDSDNQAVQVAESYVARFGISPNDAIAKFKAATRISETVRPEMIADLTASIDYAKARGVNVREILDTVLAYPALSHSVKELERKKEALDGEVGDLLSEKRELTTEIAKGGFEIEELNRRFPLLRAGYEKMQARAEKLGYEEETVFVIYTEGVDNMRKSFEQLVKTEHAELDGLDQPTRQKIDDYFQRMKLAFDERANELKSNMLKATIGSGMIAPLREINPSGRAPPAFANRSVPELSVPRKKASDLVPISVEPLWNFGLNPFTLKGGKK